MAVLDIGLQDGVDRLEQIVHRAKNGDREPFAGLVKSHQEHLRRFVGRKIPNREDAADLCQEVLLRAYLKFDTFEGRSTFRTWLLAIARREIAEYYRSKTISTTIGQYQTSRRQDLACERLAAAERSNDDILDMREQIDHCLSCIAQNLPVEEQLALILSEIYGVTDKDGSKKIGKSLAVFKHLLHKSRVMLNLISRDTCAVVKKQGCPPQCRSIGGLRGATHTTCETALRAARVSAAGALSPVQTSRAAPCQPSTPSEEHR
jgi:RNA polymerase sigma-70 factor, ECF subfamily